MTSQTRVYADVDTAPAFAKWLGKPVGGVVNFCPQPASWATPAAVAQSQSSFDWAMGRYQAAVAVGLEVCVSIPMLPTDAVGQLWQGAHDQFDAVWAGYAKSMVAHGLAGVDVRIGWEMNGGWYGWAAAHDPPSWIGYWQAIHRALRANGFAGRLVWCAALGDVAINPELVYPGDDHVDLIGLDVYNTWWAHLAATTDPQARWNNTLTQPRGLNDMAAFAKAHGKPLCLPEWGTGDSPNGFGGGDDPVFMAGMLAWIKSAGVVWDSYWDCDAGDYNAKLSGGERPKAATLYLADRGPPPALSVVTPAQAHAALATLTQFVAQTQP